MLHTYQKENCMSLQVCPSPKYLPTCCVIGPYQVRRVTTRSGGVGGGVRIENPRRSPSENISSRVSQGRPNRAWAGPESQTPPRAHPSRENISPHRSIDPYPAARPRAVRSDHDGPRCAARAIKGAGRATLTPRAFSGVGFSSPFSPRFPGPVRFRSVR